MKSRKVTPMKSDDTITVSRTEYEELQRQIEVLKARTNASSDEERIAILNSENENLKKTNDDLQQQVEWLTEQIITINRQKYVAKSEAFNEVMEQLSMMPNEVESYLTTSIVKEIQIPAHKRQRKLSVLNEEKLPDDIETEVVEHRLSEEELECPACGHTMTEIGKEVKRSLKIIPAKAIVVEDWYYTYACDNCKKNDIEVPIVKAPKENPFIEGSYASPEAVAHLMYQKYVMASPLYRMEQELNSKGIALSRQTMSNWIMTAEYDYLRPVYEKLKERLLKEDILHADETELKVVQLGKQKGSPKGYMWLFRTGKYSDNPTVLYKYEPSRSGDTPKEFLKGYKGYLQTDGYVGYHKLTEVTHVGCFAHLRRKFFEAVESGSETAAKGFGYCEALFAIESELADATFEERYKVRQEHSLPILNEFKEWASVQRVPAKSKIGQAIKYLNNQWKYLVNYTLDGRLDMTNNIAERSIKMFVIGRKNFLFSNTLNGARSTAVTMSIIETAKANDIDPYKYLLWIFKNAPKIKTDDDDKSWALLLMPEKFEEQN